MVLIFGDPGFGLHVIQSHKRRRKPVSIPSASQRNDLYPRVGSDHRLCPVFFLLALHADFQVARLMDLKIHLICSIPNIK